MTILIKFDWGGPNGLGKLGRALMRANLKAHDRVMYRAINHALDKFETALFPQLTQWTGLKTPSKTIRPLLHKKRASPGRWIGIHTTRSKYYPINPGNFKGVAWGGPSSPGGTHAAWNNPQTAEGTFAPRKYGGQLFKRTTDKRFPIKRLYGANPAREWERHRAQVEAMAQATVPMLKVEAVRLVKMEFRRMGFKI